MTENLDPSCDPKLQLEHPLPDWPSGVLHVAIDVLRRSETSCVLLDPSRRMLVSRCLWYLELIVGSYKDLQHELT